MSITSDIQSSQALEKADLLILTSKITQLLSAFASGAMSPADAQGVLDNINADDATVKTAIDSITSALTPPTPAPAAG